MRHAALAFICAIIVLFSNPSWAQGTQSVVPEQQTWQILLDRVEEAVSGGKITESNRQIYRAQVALVLSEAQAIAKSARETQGLYKNLLTAFGAAPKDGEPEEHPEITAKRKELDDKLRISEARTKQAGFAIIRANALTERISRARRSRLLDQLLVQAPAPYKLETWREALPQVLGVLKFFYQAPTIWWTATLQKEARLGTVALIFVSLVVLIVLGVAIRRFILKRFVRPASIEEPTDYQHLLSAIAEGIAQGLLPSMAVVALVAVPMIFGLIVGPFADLMTVVMTNLLLFIMVTAVVHAALAPNDKKWRVTPFSDESANMLSRRAGALMAIVTASNVALAPTQTIEVSAAFDSVFTFAVGTLTAVSLAALLKKSLWQLDQKSSVVASQGSDEDKTGFDLWLRMRQLALLVTYIAPFAAVAGYTNLSRYLLVNLLLTGLIFACAFLARSLAKELIGYLLARSQDTETKVGKVLDITESTGGTIRGLLLFLIDVSFTIGFILIALSFWGVPPEDITRYSSQAVHGITIGSYTFSLTDMALAILAFVAVMIVTRAIQWFMAERVFPQTKLDAGVRHSLKTAIGYLGIIVGLGIAVSTIGLDLSNLALVAGALSVGIGFGLQNIVSNFVSGLILLIERPVKLGDWVVAGGVEGFVRRINVRSTEIATFQKASVIIPNSELLSSAVTNWTHKDSRGRVEVLVGVAYGSDAEKVKEILLEIANEHPMVLAFPQPEVLFMEFGPSSLDFEMRVHTAQITNRLRIGSELRFAINKAFREHQIEIPFSQHDIHLRDIDRIEQSLVQAATNLTGGAGTTTSATTEETKDE
jgi:potassium-dependent mechanosensitive channel